MHPAFVPRGSVADAIPIWFVDEAGWRELRSTLVASSIAYADAAGFEPKPRRHMILPAANGAVGAVLFGIESPSGELHDRFLPGLLPGVLPPGVYRYANAPHDVRLATLAFALGSYRFTRYRAVPDRPSRLELPEGVDGADLSRIAEAVTLARDLINTPSNDMGPAELDGAARALAARYGGSVHSIEGDALLAENFPLVHAVGRASARAPRLIDLSWGDADAPKVTLVGKGVCFDSGGLDIKTEAGMRLMKKDMGGAATVLALAQMVMDRGLKLRLRVLIPAVENAISGAAFRPLDVYRARNGLTVEIGNTDAEGRLILADALAAGAEETPELMIDLGTLTGAARVALGPDLPPFYTEDEALAVEVTRCAAAENDPLWRLPLWRPYRTMLDSKIADTDTVGSGGFAGSIICALFLQRFVAAAKAWLHFDIYAWTPNTKPGRPEGGECQAARALYALLATRYG
jgi:leucyl aminopeptidase